MVSSETAKLMWQNPEYKKFMQERMKLGKMKKKVSKQENKHPDIELVKETPEQDEPVKYQFKPEIENIKLKKYKNASPSGGVGNITVSAIVYGNTGRKRFKCTQDDIQIAMPAIDDDNNLIFKCQRHDKELEIEQIYFEPQYQNTNRKVRKASLFFYTTCPICVKSYRYFDEKKDKNVGPTHIAIMKSLCDRKL